MKKEGLKQKWSKLAIASLALLIVGFILSVLFYNFCLKKYFMKPGLLSKGIRLKLQIM
jgi:hypothetical protein